MLRTFRSSRLFGGSSRRNSSNQMPAPILSQLDGPSESDPSQTHHISSTGDSGYHASRDAREIVKLFQCASCSKILEAPLILPCRNSMCTTCLQSLIPADGASQVFVCPFENCREEHGGGITRDFKLKELAEVFLETLRKSVSTEDCPATVLVGIEGSDQPPLPFNGGRLAATFELVSGGNVPYDAELAYVSESLETDILATDAANLKRLKDAIRPMVECNVCSGILLEPVTTSCGHTFCMACLQRAWDSDARCPFCRQTSNVPSVTLHQFTNNRIAEILISLYPRELTERSTQATLENSAGIDGMDTPIFVCTPSLPYVPEYLKIFEPRYKLMLRRCLEGNRRFGMVWQNPHNYPGDQGRFMRIGTMLEITDCRWGEDGMAYIQCTGLHKFVITRFGYRDEYVVGEVERYDDLSPAEEQDFERSETAFFAPHPGTLESRSTEALVEIALAICSDAFHRKPEWARAVLNAWGRPPASPKSLSYYLVTIFDAPPDVKNHTLQERCLRMRLKFAIHWWYSLPLTTASRAASTTGDEDSCLLS